MPAEVLPIDALRAPFGQALADGSVVVSSPTGSGKSTQVPRWCPGRVLVVEPRRVACRSLAQHVAELEGNPLGQDVGYHVRDEQRASIDTRILFATPGIVLRIFDAVLKGFSTVVLDEFHERSLDVDLLLALLKRRFKGHLVVMSATLEGERVATHLGGRHLHAEGRVHPVTVEHLAERTLLPDVRGLEERVKRAVESSREHPGDVLVFLPGKGEIRSCAAALRGLDAEVVELHGGLTLAEQSRAFEPTRRRKVVLSTNVAETSVTLPGIGVVIDSGLVRRTRYHRGRGFLTLSPVARDSAEQRAGRAGRTAPGVAYRLWDEAAQLERRTPPEVHRESLVPLLLAAAACGEDVETLDFFDRPKPHAVETAQVELVDLQALDEDGHLTGCGRELFGLPLDAPLGRLLVEARSRAESDPAVLDDMIDLVSILSTGRPLLASLPSEDEDDAGAPTSCCDVTILLRALRERRGRLHADTLREVLSVRKRLRRAHGLEERPPAPAGIDRRRLALAVLAADPRAAHVGRKRGRRIAFSNGGTEIELGRSSAVDRLDEVEAIVVLETRAVGLGGRDTRTLVTCAMPVPLAWLVAAGLGRDRLGELALRDGAVVARIERIFARRVLVVREGVPRGSLARQAIAELYLAGRILKGTLEASRERLRSAALARQIAARGEVVWAEEVTSRYAGEVPSLEDWVASRTEALGIESGEDLALLSPEDFLPPELPEWVRSEIDRDYPRTLELVGVAYEIDYDLKRREALLRQVKGRAHQLPPEFALPRLPGFSIKIEHRGVVRTLRSSG